MNYIWAGMILIGILYGTIQGRLPTVTNAALESAQEAVMLCITMLGIMSFWTGLMEIASQAGLVEAASRRMKPLITFLFPKIPKKHKSIQYITLNFIANFLGLGWAATPAGLQAMEALEELEKDRRKKKVPGAAAEGTANDEMCDFLILNISSLQLFPVNIIAYRSQFGSNEPTVIVGPAILATACSTLAAIIFCLIRRKFAKRY